MNRLSPTIFSFFSGAGFLDLGFELSGFKVSLVNEAFSPFIKGYSYARSHMNVDEPEYGYDDESIENFLETDKAAKLTNLIKDAKRQNELVGFIGGPPCPDFSVGGKNRGRKGDNGRLSDVYIELICQQQPDFFLFENVKGLWRTKKHREFYEELKFKLEKAGYVITEKLVNSLEYGVPQDRERIIMIGFSHKLFSIPWVSTRQYKIDFPWKLHKNFELDEILRMPWPTVSDFAEDSKLPCPKSIDKTLSVEYWFQKNKIENHPNSTHHFIPRAAKPKFLVIQEGDNSKKSFKRLHRWRYSPTACYGNNEVHLHPYKARRISAAEALAIQSLPTEYAFPENMSLTNMFKTIGNGVPFLLSEALAKSILDFITNLDNKNNINLIENAPNQLRLELAKLKNDSSNCPNLSEF